MKARIEVLSVENKKGRSKGGNDYDLHICQCVVHGEENKIQVGELMLPKGHPVVSPGLYDAEFGVSVGQDKRIGGMLKQLFPVSKASAAAGAAKAS